MGMKPQHHKRYAPIPPLLRKMRETAGLSQRALADKTAQTQNFVQTSETGSRRVDLSEFILWAQACSVSPDTALADYLASATSSKPGFWDGPRELHEGPPPEPALTPAKLRKAKDLLHKALVALGEEAQK